MVQSKISLRIYLPHLLENEETKISLNAIYDDIQTPITLYLWYDESSEEIDSIALKNFIAEWENKKHYKTIIQNTLIRSPQNFIWFDMLPRTHYEMSEWSRFKYFYSGSKNLLIGLEKFKEIIKFCFSDKPKKTQKRNDY
ncbi:MAG: hypothetical protein H8E03_01010 [Pelagibacteraceae bacterium]|nr:hypothetical protein [Pelagibacteraceae bacterium]